MVANRNALKSYAPQARKDFIQAVTNRAALFGVTKSGIEPGEERGDLFLVAGKAYPRIVAEQRRRLVARIEATSFAQTMEAVAYTWFNRLLAIRYMELHGYFEHGYRVLSHPAGEREPEILQQAQHLNLPGLAPDTVVQLKLEGDKDEVLYRRILIAQCNDLHRAMPFLFERIDDETELLLPENLLQSDSIVRRLVNEIDESEWDEIEIIGWLYQFYISEKKDQVIGKVVKSEDIPAATQLFTPNWIVKYMVQNSLGAQWLATYPQSPLKAQMAYYVEPAEQTDEARVQLAAITPRSLDPEAITLIDPAVGSGHILVEAYDLLRAIYLERGYSPTEAARAILTKNLYGLDIDDRAAQMAGFALLMKARADDRTLLRDPPALNVMSLTDSGGWDASAMADALLPTGRVELLPPADLLPETLRQPTLSMSHEDRAARGAIADIVELFDGAKTFGSLITVPNKTAASLPMLEQLLELPAERDLLRQKTQLDFRDRLAKLTAQARILGRQFDTVLANPPYMGRASMGPSLKRFADRVFPDSRTDTLSMFVERGKILCRSGGILAMVTIHNWLFLSSFERFRTNLLSTSFIRGMLHIGYNSFPEMNSKVVQAAAFVLVNRPIAGIGSYINLNDAPQSANKQAVFEGKIASAEIIRVDQSRFQIIPGSPICYWASDAIYNLFQYPASDTASALREGIHTGANERFLRSWFEVSAARLAFNCESADEVDAVGCWVPYNKGGAYRKWYGNNDLVIGYSKPYRDEMAALSGHVRPSQSLYFKEGGTWSALTSGNFGIRYYPKGFLFDSKGQVAVGGQFRELICQFNTKIFQKLALIVMPTLDFKCGDVRKMPILPESKLASEALPDLIFIAKDDWDSYETSWQFSIFPLRDPRYFRNSLSDSCDALRNGQQHAVAEMQRMEQSNNRLFIEAYGLDGELTPEVSLSEITLTCNPHYRYGGDLTDAQREARLRADTMRELISYGVGLIMGRYSLAEPGLIYADTGNVGFDPGRYGDFPADEDGIVPITEEAWFVDDAATRMEEFLKLTWPAAAVGETLATLTEGLTQGKGGDPREELRAYFSRSFYKDHLQTYRNRPIYWLFSSGKAKAFEALVYLHRYNESTLARMRTAYVTPLLGKLQQRIGDLEAEITQSGSSAEKARKTRDKDKAAKQLIELRAFDEELRHLADQRIKLDLDDGVKVNYGRFGNLLAAKDKVCGKDEKED